MSDILYFPGAMPREKNSPFLLVFRLYFCPVSWLEYSTVAPTMGLPSTSAALPLTVAMLCDQAGGTIRAADSTASTQYDRRCFISASRLNSEIYQLPSLTPRPPGSCRRWDRARLHSGKRAGATHSCRTGHRRDPRGCSRTTLNRRARPIQGQGARSATCASRSAE